MIRFEQLKSKPAMPKCLTGLALEGFLALLPTFAGAYANHLD